MSAQRRNSRMRRPSIPAAAVVAALALGAPLTEANAAKAAVPSPSVAPLAGLPAFTPPPLSFVGPAVGAVGVAIGPTVIGSVFNGGTTVCVSTVLSACSTNASP